jgi:predicted transport protein
MQLFNNTKNNLVHLEERSFKLEKDIQNIFESNLETLTGWKFIKSEFTIKANRIDTLAYDEENNSFIIIEYKKDRHFSVVDQGVSYLNLMLEYKADFIVEYNESQHESIKRADIDWSQSKVVFVSPAFTDFQKQASNFKDLPIELWEIKQYENDIILINPIKKSKAAPNIREVRSEHNSAIDKVTKEVTVYTEELYLSGKNDSVIELYESFKEAILKLSPEIEVHQKKWYIAFKTKTNIVDIEVQANTLKMWINLKKGQLDDAKNLMRDVSELKGHNGNGDYEIIVRDTENLEYIMSLVKQAL